MSSDAPTMRAGDTVYHERSGETWVLRRVDGEHVYWAGWPPGRTTVSEVQLVESCTDDEHAEMVRLDAESRARRHD